MKQYYFNAAGAEVVLSGKSVYAGGLLPEISGLLVLIERHGKRRK